jgi:hypothetical protein
MSRLCSMLLTMSVLVGCFEPALAASECALKLRVQNGLSEYTPSEGFLSGNFVADEVDPACIFGKVKDFVQSRPHSSTWLIEEGERERIEARKSEPGPVEFTLYLEEDCPERVVYYVFVDRSQANTSQWIEWRKQFHKSKTEPQYGTAKAGLEQASQNGFPVEGELRFVEIDGNLVLKKPEDVLTGELKFKPIYDLKEGKAFAR